MEASILAYQELVIFVARITLLGNFMLYITVGWHAAYVRKFCIILDVETFFKKGGGGADRKNKEEMDHVKFNLSQKAWTGFEWYRTAKQETDFSVVKYSVSLTVEMVGWFG
jgi:hypothetical protein